MKSNVILCRDDIAESRSAGVEFSGNSQGAIFACNIHNNAGPGIAVTDTAAPAIENNILFDNGVQPGSLRPDLFVHSSGRLLVTGNAFAGNGAEAVWLPAADEAIIQRNFFPGSGKGTERPKFRIVPLGEGRP